MERKGHLNISNYCTYVFDCDGVLLDSNQIKTEALYEVALPYGKDNAVRLVAYHQEYGGVSRFDKIRYFLEEILKRKHCEAEAKKLLKGFGDIVRQRLLLCDETTGMKEFVKSLPRKSRKIVASGGMQQELRDVFASRGLDNFFDAIYGSPENKYDILLREQRRGLLSSPVVFFGDSRLDYEVASYFGIDFVFISGFSDFYNWQAYFENKQVLIIKNLSELYESN